MQPAYWQFYTYARKVVKVIQIDDRVASMLVQKLPEITRVACEHNWIICNWINRVQIN